MKGGKQLIRSSYLGLLAASTAMIILAQLVSLSIVAGITAADENKNASIAAEELAGILAIPLYNVDDEQARRIAESFVSSGRVAGMRIVSTASGTVFDLWKRDASPWISTQTRKLEYKGVDLGELSFLYDDSSLANVLFIFLFSTLLLLASVVIVNFILVWRIFKARVDSVFSRLAEGISKTASGDESYAIPLSGYADIDVIIKAMNAKSAKVAAQEAELREMNEALEARVAERTAELAASLEELRAMQERVIESEKLSVLGRLSAGVAHELNSPLGAIQSAIDTIGNYLEGAIPEFLGASTLHGGARRAIVERVLEEGFKAARELAFPASQRKLVKALEARLSSSGVHESESIAGMLAEMGIEEVDGSLLGLLRAPDAADAVAEALPAVGAMRMVEVVKESGRKAAFAVSSLRSYLNADASYDGESADVDESVRRALAIMANSLKRGISVEFAASGAMAKASSDALTLVWTNMIRNAAQAMGLSGRLGISTSIQGDAAMVRIRDSGPGIPPELAPRLFAPFVTTKVSGQGLGLGIYLCKRVVEGHGGEIRFETGTWGTEFIVSLPRA